MTTRRDVIAAATMGAAAFAITVSQSKAQPIQKTFVLVHGAWGGGWVWRRVADLLEKRGHKVFAPTSTGQGERSHLLDRRVNLTVQITDIVNLIKWERLDGVLLVGWSYGGMVIAGVAEEVERAISSIVFLDALVPQNGQSALDVVGPGDFANMVHTAEQKGDIAVPPPPAASVGLIGDDRAWMDAMMTPHPIATLFEKARVTGAYERIARKAYIWAERNAELERFYQKYRSAPDWRTYAMPSGHAVPVELPERLTEILLEAA